MTLSFFRINTYISAHSKGTYETCSRSGVDIPGDSRGKKRRAARTPPCATGVARRIKLSRLTTFSSNAAAKKRWKKKNAATRLPHAGTLHECTQAEF